MALNIDKHTGVKTPENVLRLRTVNEEESSNDVTVSDGDKVDPLPPAPLKL